MPRQVGRVPHGVPIHQLLVPTTTCDDVQAACHCPPGLAPEAHLYLSTTLPPAVSSPQYPCPPSSVSDLPQCTSTCSNKIVQQLQSVHHLFASISAHHFPTSNNFGNWHRLVVPPAQATSFYRAAENEEGHGRSRRLLHWPSGAASIAATNIAIQNFRARAVVSSVSCFLCAALLRASFCVLWQPHYVHSPFPLCLFRRGARRRLRPLVDYPYFHLFFIKLEALCQYVATALS